MSTAVAPEHPFQHITRDVNKIVEQMQKGYFNARPADTWTPQRQPVRDRNPVSRMRRPGGRG